MTVRRSMTRMMLMIMMMQMILQMTGRKNSVDRHLAGIEKYYDDGYDDAYDYWEDEMDD